MKINILPFIFYFKQNDLIVKNAFVSYAFLEAASNP